MARAFVYTAESFASPSIRLDRAAGVARGVRAVGLKSRNRRLYPLPVLRAALALYDDVPVNIGHHPDPTKDVPPQDRFGRTQNARLDDRGVVVDVRYNAAHEFAPKFEWACENAPDFYSFSHTALVSWSPAARDGCRVAESIRLVASLDIVSDGGTTSGIFESARRPAESPRSREPMIDLEALVAELATPEAALGFLTELWAALPLDEPQKQALLADLANVMAGAPVAADPAADPEAAVESLRRLGRLGAWAADAVGTAVAEAHDRTRRAWADALLTAEGLAPALRSELFRDLVAESYGNEARAKAIIAERKTVGVSRVPSPGAGRPSAAKVKVSDLVSQLSAG